MLHYCEMIRPQLNRDIIEQSLEYIYRLLTYD